MGLLWLVLDRLIALVKVLSHPLVVFKVIVVLCVVGSLECLDISDQRLFDLAVGGGHLSLLLIVADVLLDPSIVLLVKRRPVEGKPVVLIVGPPRL